jgi:putative ABC transport system substrate-binding protein
MRRRDFLVVLGSAAVAWPIAVCAQQPAMPLIGFLHSGSPDSRSPFWAAFQRCLGESGFREGQNAEFAFRWAEERFERLPMLADDLVRRNVSLIFVSGGDVAALAAKKATATIPIVFAIGADPVKQGIVSSFNRPGGNITGATFLSIELRPKTLELIRELVPNAAKIGVLGNPNRPHFQSLLSEVVERAHTLDLQVHVLEAGNEREIDSTFKVLSHARIDALVVLSDPIYANHRDQIARLEIQYKVPAIHGSRYSVIAGSLASYGASIEDAYCQAGIYAARIDI